MENNIDEISLSSSNSKQKDGNSYSNGHSGSHRSKSIDNSSESSPGTSGDDQYESKQEIKEQLAKKETKVVWGLRMLVMGTLVIVAVAVSWIVHTITSSAESDDFVGQYDGVSNKIMDSFEAIIDRIGSVSAIATAATIYGIDNAASGRKWPFFTLSSFQQRAASARQLSGALYVKIDPIISDSNRKEWEIYSIGNDRKWFEEGLDFQEMMGMNIYEDISKSNDTFMNENATSQPIFYYNSTSVEPLVDPGPGPYLPSWIKSPIVSTAAVNENLLRRDSIIEGSTKCLETGKAVLGRFDFAPIGDNKSPDRMTAFYAVISSISEKKPQMYMGDPMARIYIPVFDSFRLNRTIVAINMAVINWKYYLHQILPSNVIGIEVVLENTCSGSYTYIVNGPEVELKGFGDLHDPKFAEFHRSLTVESQQVIADGSKNGVELYTNTCNNILHIYPSQVFYDSFITSAPALTTAAVASVFIFTILMFLVFDRLVEKRQRIVLEKAAQATSVVSSLFPKNVRAQLLQEEEDGAQNTAGKSTLGITNRKWKQFENGTKGLTSTIADLFLYCTVMFADIAGFTAWCSTREPEHVFILLQTLYHHMDMIAKRLKVYKVETIGDCYVAVTGLPEPQKNHALIMARFAWECKEKMKTVMQDLEKMLGPDCSDLKLRFGLHSGPVTAGVLRGERARFQLFGDTVNTASRMESTGIAGKIQISQETANILTTHMKGHWIEKRPDLVNVKGKGKMQTYWLNPSTKKLSNESSSQKSGGISENEQTKQDSEQSKNVEVLKRDRLIDWMVELLLERLKNLVSARKMKASKEKRSASLYYQPPPGIICLDEHQEIIHMVKMDRDLSGNIATSDSIDIEPDVVNSLRDFVFTISQMYHSSNAFHNFNHACHVTMSMNKLLKRIIAKESNDLSIDADSVTYGLWSDHMAQFAVVFSGLIHDVDHRGCSNARLIEEEPHLGSKYRNKSVAEQNSLDIAWGLFMEKRFDRLREVIFDSQDELLRFRHLLVNNILATDVFDKDLNELRQARWNKAFLDSDTADKFNADRKATIVMEHIIQASDVSHTMQHFHIYLKWNKQLFTEMYTAYRTGRLSVNPGEFWYEGELSFFDKYVLPLAKKLKECKVFGVSSDEYLNYAIANRAEWEAKGQAIVAELLLVVGDQEECNTHMAQTKVTR